MTSPLPAITPETLEAAVAAIDVDDLNANYLRGNVDVGDIRTIIAAAVPVLLSEHREQIAREIEAMPCGKSDGMGPLLHGPARARAIRQAAAIARGSRLSDSGEAGNG